MTRMVCGLLLVIMANSPGVMAGSWELELEEAGIRVESRELPDSDIRAFRAFIQVDASAESVLAVMDDPESYTRWVYGCSYSAFLGNPDFFHRLSYQINDMPLWITDRDLVMRVAVSEEAGGDYLIRMWNAPDAFPDQGLVRVNRLEGSYRISPLSPSQSRITWQQHIEPGGFLPDWLVNQLLQRIPFYSLQNLQGLVEGANSPYRARRLQRDAGGRIIGWAENQGPRAFP